MTVVSWIQENAMLYLDNDDDDSKDKQRTENKKTDSFSRYWIYSHHIYSKVYLFMKHQS